MNKILKYSLLSLVVIGVAGVSVVGAQAQNGNSNYPPVIQKIAEKFNLNVADVKAVFDANQQERMQERLEKSGLTTAQATALQAKRDELHEKYGLLKDLSQEERKVKMQQMHEEMKTFAEANGINLGSMKGMGPKSGNGFGCAFKELNTQNK